MTGCAIYLNQVATQNAAFWYKGDCKFFSTWKLYRELHIRCFFTFVLFIWSSIISRYWTFRGLTLSWQQDSASDVTQLLIKVLGSYYSLNCGSVIGTCACIRYWQLQEHCNPPWLQEVMIIGSNRRENYNFSKGQEINHKTWNESK